jgi:4-aminobutyrate aminotransferase
VGDRTTSVDGVTGFPGEDVCGLWCLGELSDLLDMQTAPTETAAILLEPALGEGGYVHPPRIWLRGVREIADDNDILLIADEIQSGFGRTGKFFALEHADVVPDIIAMAKALASGFPLSGIATRPDLMERWRAGTHGGTYGGNAVSCAAAVATLQVFQEEGLVENAAEMGEHLLERLREVQKHHPVIGDVRGRGLMVATEFTASDGTPAAIAEDVAAGCLARGMLMLTAGHRHNILRWIPPLIVTEEQIDRAVEIFEEALAEAV